MIITFLRVETLRTHEPLHMVMDVWRQMLKRTYLG